MFFFTRKTYLIYLNLNIGLQLLAIEQAFKNFGKTGIVSTGIGNLSIQRSDFEDVPVFTSDFGSASLLGVNSTTANKFLNFEFKNGSKVSVRNNNISTGSMTPPIFGRYSLPQISKI